MELFVKKVILSLNPSQLPHKRVVKATNIKFKTVCKIGSNLLYHFVNSEGITHNLLMQI